MDTATRTTFVCATCRQTVDIRLAVDYKPHRGPVKRICCFCENAIIGVGEEAAIEAIQRATNERESHLVQAGMLSVLTPGGGRVDLTTDDLKALRELVVA